MKNARISLTVIISILVCQISMAQSGSWNKAGNSLSGTEKLGSTNSRPVRFFTNNLQRMTLDAEGKLGIGALAPKAKLHLSRGGSGVLTPFSGSTLIVESDQNNFISLLNPSGKGSGILFGNGNNAQDGGIIFDNPVLPRSLQFKVGSSITQLVVTHLGQVGVGTLVPKAKLHVLKSNTGISPNDNANLVVESTGSNFINLLTPSTTNSGILFGNNLNSSDGGIIYNSGSTPRGLQFNTGGNSTRMVVASNGFVGIGTRTPASELHIVHSNTNNATIGLRLENGPANKHWVFFTGAGGGMNLSANGQFKGFFSPDGGDYFATSDARAKKDILKAPAVLEKVLQLEVKQYHFLGEQSSDKKHYGMLAQEVEKLFPEMVAHKTDDGQDRYFVNQSTYGVVALKAIQEQQQTIEKQQLEIAELRTIVRDLQAAINPKAPATISPNKVETGAGARLLQNAPNPFHTETSIRYYLPEIKGSAAIGILSSDGQVIKTYPVTQKGNGQVMIKSGELTAGTYYYILKLNGEKVDTKRMIVVK
ncbi:hypothetical protein AHMF7605_18510 [Adhaeribacter arboris]|uniref:Peptidase S74 domain-containing protein n=1 Tax=Adhaeribacter arboris TaxID=2072846 RepID=A0A2T2YIM8_9BACT|nr:tail fiber domain-containing protein [Adhaeribacter arboris]PSR55357.1 hypothetical protein AHMF7605_18510 [Adhaeribacter arboris]